MDQVRLLGVIAGLLCINSAAWGQLSPISSSGVVRLPPAEADGGGPLEYPSTPSDSFGTAPEQRPAAPPAPQLGSRQPGSAVVASPPQAVPAANWPGGERGDLYFESLRPGWHVSAAGLVLGRDDVPGGIWLSHEAGNADNLLMNTQTGSWWQGGWEIRLGRSFGEGGWAVEAAYWAIEPADDIESRTHANLVSTPLDFSGVGWADPRLPGSPGNLFNAAGEHRLWRRNEVQNVELAVVQQQDEFLSRDRRRIGWSVAARYFRFAEDLRFGSMDQNGMAFGIDPTMEGYLEDSIVNDLVGVELGYCFGYSHERWRVYAFPKIGVYGNHIEHRFSAYRGDGQLLAPVAAGSLAYPVRSTKDVVSSLTEFDVGFEWQVAARWMAVIGYRLIVATGVGLADDQMSYYVADTMGIADIDSSGRLLLYGGYAGVTCRF